MTSQEVANEHAKSYEWRGQKQRLQSVSNTSCKTCKMTHGNLPQHTADRRVSFRCIKHTHTLLAERQVSGTQTVAQHATASHHTCLSPQKNDTSRLTFTTPLH